MAWERSEERSYWTRLSRVDDDSYYFWGGEGLPQRADSLDPSASIPFCGGAGDLGAGRFD